MIRLAEATILNVLDGATLDSMLDIGWGIVLRPRGKKATKPGGAGTIRCIHADGSKYDAPEKSTNEGRLAQAFARELIRPGQELTVISFGLDDFGRTLGAVKLLDGRDWADVMTEAGYVK